MQDLGFLERTARLSLSWEQLPERPQTSRMRLTVKPGGLIKSRSLASCAHCNEFLEETKRCGGCNRVSYCNKTCQRAGWPAHKVLCRSLAAAAGASHA